MASYIMDQKHITYIDAIQVQCSQYQRRGFMVQHIFMDTEFQFLEKSINENGLTILDTENYKKNSIDLTINVSGKGDNVPEPKRMIRTIKDGTRCTKASLAMFKKFPKRFGIEI